MTLLMIYPSYDVTSIIHIIDPFKNSTFVSIENIATESLVTTKVFLLKDSIYANPTSRAHKYVKV